MEKPLVSVIIPFYNEELYLERAIHSAIKQTYKNIEIILVNDGSTDNSKNIAYIYISKYKHVKLITNPTNESLGASRNNGLVLAKGKYITFLDADDELEDEMITICVKEVMQENNDLVIARFSLLDENNHLLKISGWKNMPKITTSIDCIKAIYSNNIVPTAWGKLYKKEIIKNIKFPEKIWFEDTPFLLETLLNSNKVSLITESLLKIHSRKESITRKIITTKRIDDIHNAFILELQIIDKYKIEPKCKNEIETMIFQNNLMAMMDNFIIYSIDKKKTNDKNDIQKTFLNVLANTKKLIRKRNSKISIKNKILLLILFSPKYINWAIPELLIYLLKYKKYNFIKQLKG